MGNMKCINIGNFIKGHAKKGHKIIGWDQAEIIDQKGDIYLTSPWESENNGRPNYPDAHGEWMVWKEDIMRAEFLKKEDAVWFFNYLAERINKEIH